MKELENFYCKVQIDTDFHNKSLNSNEFNKMTQRIYFEENSSILNQIYWLSMTLYRISFTSYLSTFSENYNNAFIKENLLVYYPFSIFSSEICRIIKNDYIYSSLLSTIARQMIEQICVTKEIYYENIDNNKIVESMIESHNLHVGAKSLEIAEINSNNEGILKVFNTGRKYGNLAKKYNFHFLYKLYSGDIHHITTIDKCIPKLVNDSNNYNEVYLLTLLSLIKEAILFVNNYSKKLSQEDIKKLNNYNFVKILDK